MHLSLLFNAFRGFSGKSLGIYPDNSGDDLQDDKICDGIKSSGWIKVRESSVGRKEGKEVVTGKVVAR